jgi:hypothetical protein
LPFLPYSKHRLIKPRAHSPDPFIGRRHQPEEVFWSILA